MSCKYCIEYEDLPEFVINGKPEGRVFDTCIQETALGWVIELPSGNDIGIKFCPYCGRNLDSTTEGYNIGDTIYYINPRTNTIETDTIIRLTITKSGCNPILAKHTTKFWKHFKWFTSYKEAENYIKELKKSN